MRSRPKSIASYCCATGRIVADGCKQEVLTEELLSEVYETQVRVVEIDGYYLAYPGENAKT